MRTPLLALLPAALAATQVYLYPTPPNAGSYAPTLNAAQANAVMSHHLGGDVASHETPEDEGMWSHLLHLWDNGEKRPRVVILEGGDAQCESVESAAANVLALLGLLMSLFACCAPLLSLWTLWTRRTRANPSPPPGPPLLTHVLPH